MRITLTDAEKTLYSDPLELCLYILRNAPDLLTEIVNELYPEQKLKHTGMTTPTGSFYKYTKAGETNLVHISPKGVLWIDPGMRLEYERIALGITTDPEVSSEIVGFIVEYFNRNN